MNQWLAVAALLGVGLSMGCGNGEEGGPAGDGKASADSGEKIKIGFLVKQPEEQWFQDEWKYAEEAGTKLGFEVVKIGTPKTEDVLSAIDNLAAQNVKGFVICTPDVNLGPAIVMKAKKYNMKLISVDDQFVGADGKFMDVHHVGISAHDIGFAGGEAIWAEMQKRGWKVEDTALFVPTWDRLATSKERYDGAMEALAAKGYPKEKMYLVPQQSADVQGGFDAANIALTQHANVKKWLVFGMNDEAVLGSVRAMDARKLRADQVIGVGIGGTKTAQDEFAKKDPTGFFGTMLINPIRHGYDPAEMMYKWIKDGVEPPKITYTKGILITREDYKQKLKEQGLD
jgi:L-arabinose transport system substrate-binding protein